MSLGTRLPVSWGCASWRRPTSWRNSGRGRACSPPPVPRHPFPSRPALYPHGPRRGTSKQGTHGPAREGPAPPSARDVRTHRTHLREGRASARPGLANVPLCICVLSPGNLAAKLDCRSKPPIPSSPVKVLILLRTGFSFSSLMNRPALFPRPPSARAVLTDRRLGEETACAEEWRGGGGWNDCRAPRARGKIVDFFCRTCQNGISGVPYCQNGIRIFRN